MGRQRQVSPANIYHMTSRGTAHQMIFEDDGDREFLLSQSVKLARENGVELYAWCFMSNHIHMLVHAPLEDVAKYMKSLLATYARHFNRRRERSGHVFQGRYKSEPIDTDEYLLTVIRYIHQNPEVAGIAPTVAYQWSSYAEYAGLPMRENMPTICSKDFPLSVFGGRDAFIRFHQTLVNASEHDDCMMRTPARADPDERALAVATEVVGMSPSEIKTLTKPTRDDLLSKLRRAGLSVRTIERITGIGRGIISRIPAT